jgi:hypothetical protein
MPETTYSWAVQTHAKNRTTTNPTSVPRTTRMGLRPDLYTGTSCAASGTGRLEGTRGWTRVLPYYGGQSALLFSRKIKGWFWTYCNKDKCFELFPAKEIRIIGTLNLRGNEWFLQDILRSPATSRRVARKKDSLFLLRKTFVGLFPQCMRQVIYQLNLSSIWSGPNQVLSQTDLKLQA